MLKGVVASIFIAVALFLIYDVSNSFYAACVTVPAPGNAVSPAPAPIPAPVVVLVPAPAPAPVPVAPPADGQTPSPVTPPVTGAPAPSAPVVLPQIASPPPVVPPAPTMELCGFDRSLTVSAARAVFGSQGAIMTAAVFALVIIGAIIAFFTGKMAAAAQRSADYARRTAENLPKLERGYVFVSQVDKSTWVSVDNERIMVAMDVRNYGRTPTVLIETYGEFLSAPPEVRPAKYPFDDANKQVHQVVLAPGAPALRLDDRFFGKFVEPAYFLGYVKYRDVFRATHVSCWCLKSRRIGEGWVWDSAGVAGWDDYD